MLDLLYREKYKMSEQKPTIATMPFNAWTATDKDLSEDTPSRPPPLTRMSTGAYIDRVFMTKDEMMFTPLRIENAQSASSSSLITAPEGGVLNERRCKMKMDSDKAKEKKDV